MKKILIFSTFTAVIMLSFAYRGLALYPSTTPWLMYRHDVEHSGATPSDAPSDGSLLWSHSAPASGSISIKSTPLIVDGRVIYQVTDRVFAVDETTGVELWRHNAAGWLTAPTAEDGRVFLGISSNAGGVICINASTGEEIWKQDLSPNYVMGSPLVNNGIVYAGVTGNYTHAFNATTGHYKWGYMTDGPVYSSPAADGDILFFGSDDTKLYALNVSGPTPISLWNFTANGAIRSTPAINGDRVFFGSDNNKLYAVNKTTGELIWSWATATPSAKMQNGVAVANNIVYVTSTNLAKIYALHADAAPGNYTEADLAIRYWTKDASSDGVSGLNEPVYASGKIIVTNIGGNPTILYALDADVGNVLWKSQGGYWSSVGNAVVADGRAWFSKYYADPAWVLNLYCIGTPFPPSTIHYTINAGGTSFDVALETNSTVKDFNTTALETEGKINFKVQGIGATDMSNITIPDAMLSGPFNVTVDGEQPLYMAEPISNGTHTALYFTYNGTIPHTVEITGTTFIPEFQPIIIAPLILAVSFAIVLFKSKRIARLR